MGDAGRARIDRQLGALAPDAPILADWPGIGFADPYSFSFTAELRRRDIPFVVADRYLVRQFGPDRRYDGHNARSKVFYKLGQAARPMRLGPVPAGRVPRRARGRRPGRGTARLAAAARDALLQGRIRPAPGLGGGPDPRAVPRVWSSRSPTPPRRRAR